MKVLGIETSCDETSASVVEDGHKLLSLVVNSQIDIHKAFGGVVPEVAARSHIEVMIPVVQQALDEAKLTWSDIDAIAVTQGPGLLGSLLIGVLTARTLAWSLNKPLFPVHHIMGHVYANWLISTGTSEHTIEQSSLAHSDSLVDSSLQTVMLNSRRKTTPVSASRRRLDSPQSPEEITSPELFTSYNLPAKQPEFPVLALIVSGGHSQLMLFENHLKCRILGKTRDDAVGEAFDKVAKIIGLPYPGGPSIERVAPRGDSQAYKLPTAKLDNPYEFSFSGLKTAVLRTAQKVAGVGYDFPSFELAKKLSQQQKYDIAASFQERAVQTLADATKRAAAEYQPKSIILGGGVAASQALRHKLTEVLDQPVLVTDPKLCTDNAAMIACLGYYVSKQRQPVDPYSLTTEPSLKIVESA